MLDLVPKIFVEWCVSRRTFLFKLQLPKNCRITHLADNNKGYERCGFTVDLDIPTHRDIHYDGPLEVLPGREFLAIIETLEKNPQLKEQEGSRWTNDGNHKFHFGILSQDSPMAGFYSMYFELSQTDDGVAGTLDICMVPSLAKGVWQRFWALLRIKPVETKPFELTSSQLFLSDGTINHSAIAKAIEHEIDSIIAPRRNRAF